MNMSNIAPLAAAWIEAKRAETKANAERIKIEEQLAAALEVPAEGSKTHSIDGYKITVTQPITRKLDEAAWAKVKAKCPMEAWPIKTKIEVDATGVKWLQSNDQKVWRAIASAFETKPGKVGLKVEAI